MKLTRLIESLRLPKEARDDLERIIALPEVEAILGREEEQTIQQRRELRKQLDALLAKYKKATQEAEATAESAAKRLESAQAELQAARSAHNYAAMVARGLDLQIKGEAKELKAQLYEGRDSRMDDFFLTLDTLEQVVKNLLTVWPIVTKRAFGGNETVYADNRDDVDAALAVIRDGMRQAEEIALDALSRQEVTERLAAICHSLDAPLAKFELTAPTVDQYGDFEPRMPPPDVLRHKIEAAA